ncbi:MAG TPA: hypothetical protein VHG08_09300 [Longimicrobium sp.]|nr:hypothetical protein [Longimicrobium sp.]
MLHALPRRLRALVLAPIVASLAAACGGGGEADAPAKAQAGGQLITGFAGTEWGATRQQIEAARGAPDTVRPYFEGVQALGYEEDEMFTARVQSVFFVHPEHGMFRAGYAAHPRAAGQCEVVYGLMERAVQQRYPGLEPEARQGNQSDQPFCAAVLAGQATRMTRWRDSAGTVIYLLAAPGASEILLMFSTARANEWEARKNSGRL